jgi:hypothetical protein
MAPLDVVYLSIVLVHLVLSRVDLLLVRISKFLVFRACGEGEVGIVQVFEVDLLCHLDGTSGYWKALINLVVARVSHLLESLVLCVIPCLKQVAQVPPVYVTCG